MERPIFKPIGTPVEDLDTPALVVDLDLFRANVKRVHSYFVGRGSKIRPFVGIHRCPALAHLQLAEEGHTGGLAVGTVGQAEAFVDAGVTDIMITGKAVTSPKIASLCALAMRADVSIAVDSVRNVTDISSGAVAAGVEIDLLVEIETGLGLTGVVGDDAAVELATAVADAPGVQLRGLATYGGPRPPEGGRAAGIDAILSARQALESAGLECRTVAAGSSADYQVAGAVAGVTEVVAGAYALGDYRYEQIRSDIDPAGMIMGTIVSTPVEGIVVGDAGMKTNGNDTGLPRVVSIPGATVDYLSAEHCNLNLPESGAEVSIGDKVWFVPYDMGVAANHFDYIMAVRSGRLAGILDVTARGRYR